MKIAASMSVGRLAPKHSLNIDNIRVISKNVTPKLIRDDVVILDRLRGQNGKHLTIEEYTDQHFQPYIDQYNAKQRRKDRQIQTGYNDSNEADCDVCFDMDGNFLPKRSTDESLCSGGKTNG